MTWLTPPYYKAPPPQRVDCGKFFGSQPTAETMMQVNTFELLSYPQGFMFGAGDSGAQTPEGLTAEIVAYAKSLMESPVAALTGVDAEGTPFNPEARGAFHAEIVIDTLKQIPASRYNWHESGSVYDVWVRGKSL